MAGLLLAGCATTAGSDLRPFADRPIAWHEGDDAHVPRPPKTSNLQELDITLIVRDSVARELDRHLAVEPRRPARDVNALDEVPCSTWFCPRHHLRPLSAEELAAGPPDARPPRLPLKIVKGKNDGAALGFQVRDADGRKFLLKLDPAGFLGLASTAEVVGSRLFHAAGYNVPGSFIVDLGPEDLQLAPDATYSLPEGGKRPLTIEMVRQQLKAAAFDGNGKLRAAAVSWLPGEIIGSFDTYGRRSDDPNDTIPHQHRRSLRASRVLFAWLNNFDGAGRNTLDSYVEQNGRKFVKHHFIDFGASLGSATIRPKGPHEGYEPLVEIERSVASFFALGLYRHPWQGQRGAWQQAVQREPALGWLPANFDPDRFHTLRESPAHERMTERDAYWGAKLVTSFSDEEIAQVVEQARLPSATAEKLTSILSSRRDAIGRRYLRANTATERLQVGARGDRLCFEDLAIARGHARAEEVRYALAVRGGGAAAAPATGARTCVPLRLAAGEYQVVTLQSHLSGRPARPTRVHLSYRPSERRWTVVGVERDE